MSDLFDTGGPSFAPTQSGEGSFAGTGPQQNLLMQQLLPKVDRAAILATKGAAGLAGGSIAAIVAGAIKRALRAG